MTGIGLDNPKHMVNVGAVLRACGFFGADFLAIRGKRYKRTATDTAASYRTVPLFSVEDLHTIIPFNCVPVAVELCPGAYTLFNYTHPPNAFYIFGAEDATLGKRVLGWCRDRIHIQGDGCLNLAACVNVVLYDRIAKEARAR